MLEDGSVWRGVSFGAKGTEVGEVVFNTSITGGVGMGVVLVSSGLCARAASVQLMYLGVWRGELLPAAAKTMQATWSPHITSTAAAALLVQAPHSTLQQRSSPTRTSDSG